ncbi:MAG: response regulator [Bacteroidales bacterium]|nr:response regulator [Bacteroidales bacterium]
MKIVEESNKSSINWAQRFNWSDKLILIVEDVEANHLFISSALSRTNAKMLWAKNGKDAVKLALENPDIDLVLMDIRLPELDGYEATKQIKAFRKNLPIIAQTAYVMSNEKGKVLQAGCDDLITKPIRLKVLLETVAKHLIQ